MIQLSELLGHDAIDISTATVSGSVTGIGLAGDRIVVVGLRGSSIDAATVRGFDGDVLTYAPSAAATPATATTAATTSGPTALPAPGDPRGTRVLDLRGDLLGTIADLTITDSGTVDTILLAGGHAVRGSRLRAIGSYAAIVTADDR